MLTEIDLDSTVSEKLVSSADRRRAREAEARRQDYNNFEEEDDPLLPSSDRESLSSTGTTSKHKYKQNQKTEGSQLTKARLAGEFTVPTGVPNGLVGTPLTTLHTNFHLLPSSLIQRLGIGSLFHQIQGRRFDYQEINYPYDDDEKLQRIQQHR